MQQIAQVHYWGREARLRRPRHLTVLVLALLLVAGACGGTDDESGSGNEDTARADCVGFYLGTFGGDSSGPYVLSIADDGSLSAAFVRPDVLDIDLTDVASLSGLLDEIGLVLGEDIIVSRSGLEIAPGAIAAGLDGVRLGNIQIGFAPAGTVGPAGVVQPETRNGAEITGDFRWATCTGSGRWVDGEESGRWQVALAAGGITLAAGDCEGGIYVGVDSNPGGLDIDLDAFCLSESVSDLALEPIDEGVAMGVTDDVSVYTLEETVLFDFGSAALTPTAADALATVSAAITQQGSINPTIQVIGHTDSIGSSESNLQLSKRRAEAVRADLAERLPDATVAAFGLGETNPAAPNANPDGTDNPTGRKQNRRVEIIVIG